MADLSIRVEGARELRRELRTAANQGLKADLKASNKEAAEVVADAAKPMTRQKSGALARSIRALGSQTKGQVAMGRGATRLYAGVQHYGWPGHNISPDKSLLRGLAKKRDEVREAYSKRMEALGKRLSR